VESKEINGNMEIVESSVKKTVYSKSKRHKIMFAFVINENSNAHASAGIFVGSCEANVGI
jgi:hypothetical protein